ncbi:MAG: DUF86 domain-containing protein [Lachnospiraceae bacterium]|nr:DUF86 domain-containing protein [Lachnospiraceae bacterium]MCD7766560.1 DUF86 domain-containing protein [Lachnospiraceae bacterium]
MNKGDRERLLHICRYCIDIGDFIQRFGNEFNNFINDRAYMNAVCMSVLQIGELANGLSEEFREETKGQMPWGMIRGMRNWLAHAYSSMDESIIWETATNDIPSLLEFCEKQLEKDQVTHGTDHD